MLFNSYTFIFIFLPITLAGYFALQGKGFREPALAWLVGASLVFYGSWNPAYLLLLVGSVLFNFLVGRALASSANEVLPAGVQLRGPKLRQQAVLFFGVAGNLAALGYFKYTGFFLDNLNATLGTSFYLEAIILPLGISFFTFQQIAYLVDAYRGEAQEPDLLRYSLFVVFFPQLIAGPIVHHREMLPQFLRKFGAFPDATDLAVGVTIFSIGLFKKVIIADGMAQYSDPVFAAATGGQTLAFFEAWGATVAYSLQIYFDFSGYTDMAIGLARMFGIHLPLNFNSPYKSTSIIEFWRRWHMTLSRFLRDYLYFPLGGSRKGFARAAFALVATMFLGGLWHGAAWTFVAWGLLHGVYLVVNHSWRAFRAWAMPCRGEDGWLARVPSLLLTYLAVTVAWVLFRAESMDAAFRFYEAMLGLNGIALPYQMANRIGGLEPMLASIGLVPEAVFVIHPRTWITGVPAIVLVLLIVWFAPNSQQLMGITGRPPEADKAEALVRPDTQLRRRFSFSWRASPIWAAATSVMATVGIFGLSRPQAFIYFQF